MEISYSAFKDGEKTILKPLFRSTRSGPKGRTGSGVPTFSCKRCHFCPSCHQKRVVEFGEWFCSRVFKKVPHRHIIFGIPKILRRYFLYDRDLLSDLSRCAWESLKLILQETVPEKNPIPGAVIAIKTFGDSPNISNRNR